MVVGRRAHCHKWAQSIKRQMWAHSKFKGFLKAFSNLHTGQCPAAGAPPKGVGKTFIRHLQKQDKEKI